MIKLIICLKKSRGSAISAGDRRCLFCYDFNRFGY